MGAPAPFAPAPVRGIVRRAAPGRIGYRGDLRDQIKTPDWKVRAADDKAGLSGFYGLQRPGATAQEKQQAQMQRDKDMSKRPTPDFVDANGNQIYGDVTGADARSAALERDAALRQPKVAGEAQPNRQPTGYEAAEKHISDGGSVTKDHIRDIIKTHRAAGDVPKDQLDQWSQQLDMPDGPGAKAIYQGMTQVAKQRSEGMQPTPVTSVNSPQSTTLTGSVAPQVQPTTTGNFAAPMVTQPVAPGAFPVKGSPGVMSHAADENGGMLLPSQARAISDDQRHQAGYAQPIQSGSGPYQPGKPFANNYSVNDLTARGEIVNKANDASFDQIHKDIADRDAQVNKIASDYKEKVGGIIAEHEPAFNEALARGAQISHDTDSKIDWLNKNVNKDNIGRFNMDLFHSLPNADALDQNRYSDDKAKPALFRDSVTGFAKGNVGNLKPHQVHAIARQAVRDGTATAVGEKGPELKIARAGGDMIIPAHKLPKDVAKMLSATVRGAKKLPGAAEGTEGSGQVVAPIKPEDGGAPSPFVINLTPPPSQPEMQPTIQEIGHDVRDPLTGQVQQGEPINPDGGTMALPPAAKTATVFPVDPKNPGKLKNFSPLAPRQQAQGFVQLPGQGAQPTEGNVAPYTVSPLWGDPNEPGSGASMRMQAAMTEAQQDAVEGRPINPLVATELARRDAYEKAKYDAAVNNDKREFDRLKQAETTARVDAVRNEARTRWAFDANQKARQNNAMNQFRYETLKRAVDKDNDAKLGKDPASLEKRRLAGDQAAGVINAQGKNIDAQHPGALVHADSLMKEGRFHEAKAFLDSLPYTTQTLDPATKKPITILHHGNKSFMVKDGTHIRWAKIPTDKKDQLGNAIEESVPFMWNDSDPTKMTEIDFQRLHGKSDGGSKSEPSLKDENGSRTK